MILLSPKELLEIFIALLFSAIILSYPTLSLDFLILSFLIAFISIFFHELAHKYFAVKFGREDVKIKMHLPGIAMGLFLAIISNGSIFLVIPAYVSYKITSELKDEELIKEAKISIVGPFVNGMISIASLLLLFTIKYVYGGFLNYLEHTIAVGSFFGYMLPLFLLQLAYFNGMLSFINMIPFFGTDGEKFSMISMYFYEKGKDYGKLPWHLFIVCVAGMIIYFLLGWTNIFSEEVFYAYEMVSKKGL